MKLNSDKVTKLESLVFSIKEFQSVGARCWSHLCSSFGKIRHGQGVDVLGAKNIRSIGLTLKIHTQVMWEKSCESLVNELVPMSQPVCCHGA